MELEPDWERSLPDLSLEWLLPDLERSLLDLDLERSPLSELELLLLLLDEGLLLLDVWTCLRPVMASFMYRGITESIPT